MKIDVYSHFFKVTLDSLNEEYMLNYLKKRLSIVNFQDKDDPGRKFYIVTNQRMEYRFHVNTLQILLDGLNYRNYTRYTIEHHQAPIFEKIDLPHYEKWVLRDYQIDPFNYLVDDDNNTKILTLQTGKGKTAVSLLALSKLSSRFAMVIKPAYLDKWASDVLGILDIVPDDVVLVVGGDQLRVLIHRLQENTLDCKVYIFSNRTFTNFLDEYERDPVLCKELYGIVTDELWSLLKVNTLLIDEVHQDFNSVYKTLMHTNIHKFIGLSATLDTNVREVKNLYEITFPHKIRYVPPSYDQYVNVYSCGYNVDNIKGIRVSEFGRSSYSHMAFEKSVSKRKILYLQYKEMIKTYCDLLFFKDYKQGDKLAVFCSTINMCQDVCDYLQNSYPDLDVRTYVGKDPYENVIESDIRVTTIGSAGTAIDIPNLTTVLLTINVLSLQSNLQTIGRLRKIEGREVNFGYLYCKNIRQHVKYHKERMKLLEGRAKSYRFLDYNRQLVNR